MTAGGEQSARYEEIARDVERRIRAGELPPGRALPTMTALAAEYGVARGTVRHALESLDSSGGVIARRGTRWIPHEPTVPQRLDSLLSFGQWARATGRTPSGITVRQAMGRATGEEARSLGTAARDRVLRVERLRLLDGRPVLVERTTYPSRIARIIQALPADTESVMDVLETHHGIRASHAELRISAMGASPPDARLLRVQPHTPLLRLQRTTREAGGRAIEHSEDRSLPDAVAFSLVPSAR